MNFKTYQSFINERAKYDGLSSHLTRDILKQWVKDWKGNKKSSSYEDSIFEILEFDIEATLIFTKDVNGFIILNSTGSDANTKNKKGKEQSPFIIIHFAINPEWLPAFWSEIYMYLADVVRHEIEHITQGGGEIGNYKTGKPFEDDTEIRKLIEKGILPNSAYLTLPKEIDANLQGLRFESKKRKERMIVTINNYLDTQNLTQEERTSIINVWRERANKIGGIPKF